MNKSNVAPAIEANIPREQARGKWVVAEYEGTAFVGYETFSTEPEAEAAMQAITGPGKRAVMHDPVL